MGLRMPPKATSPDTFWNALLKGVDAMSNVPAERWDWRHYFDEEKERPGKVYVSRGGFLTESPKLFDPLAFGISPREAECMDPQQRMLLEVTWEAFEDAGLPLERVAGTRTGVFIGSFCMDHMTHNTQPANRPLVNLHSPPSATATILANRISYIFDLNGPSVTLDTACSSSLVSLHYACSSLLNGEADLALAGGVNLLMRPEPTTMMCKGRFLSDLAQCRTFDADARGYVRGEGAGVVVLKPLDKAIADSDDIYAVIRATGVNQDGQTNGIASPNTSAQEALMRSLYSAADISPSEVSYVEAHGTGTQAGDQAETRAISALFGSDRNDSRVIVGSVKSNIGHLEASAGIAGLIKTALIMRHRKVPPNLHFDQPNPDIPFGDYALEIPKAVTELPSEGTLNAGINSFGYGGTNAHAILETPPTVELASAPDSDEPLMITLSARSQESLLALAGKFAFRAGQGKFSLGNLAHTTAFRRSHLDHRLAILADNAESLRDTLMQASAGEQSDTIIRGETAATKDLALVFVFTGMGPQWWAMGRELIQREPIVSQAIDEVDSYFHKLAGWSLREAMLADEATSCMARTEVAQPANLAIQVALARLWESRGIRAAACVGHSVGEVASAWYAGVYSLEDAIKVSYHRSRLQQTVAGLGSMLAVGLSAEDALAAISGYSGVSIGAINSFTAVTLSGDTDELKAIAASLDKDEVFNKFLRVEVAYHSPQMESLREELLAALADLNPQPEQLPLYSTAFGERLPSERWNADYWWQNVRQPVHFAECIQLLIQDEYSHFLEVGPHPVLGNSIKECAVHLGTKAVTVPSIRRKEPEVAGMMQALAKLYTLGCTPDWASIAPVCGRFVRGPAYPWQKKEYWLKSER